MSNRRMLERLTDIPVAKAIFTGYTTNQYGQQIENYDVYHSTTHGFIVPDSAVTLVSAWGIYLYGKAILHTQDTNFNPDLDQNGKNAPYLTDYIYYNGEWHAPSQYVDFSPTTYGKYKKYQIVDNRQLDVPWKDFSSYYTTYPDYSEISTFEKAVGSLATRNALKIEPTVNKLIETL